MNSQNIIRPDYNTALAYIRMCLGQPNMALNEALLRRMPLDRLQITAYHQKDFSFDPKLVALCRDETADLLLEAARHALEGRPSNVIAPDMIAWHDEKDFWTQVVLDRFPAHYYVRNGEQAWIVSDLFATPDDDIKSTFRDSWVLMLPILFTGKRIPPQKTREWTLEEIAFIAESTHHLAFGGFDSESFLFVSWE